MLYSTIQKPQAHLLTPITIAESAKARLILEEFINPSITGNPGKELPSRVLAQAKVRETDHHIITPTTRPTNNILIQQNQTRAS